MLKKCGSTVKQEGYPSDLRPFFARLMPFKQGHGGGLVMSQIPLLLGIPLFTIGLNRIITLRILLIFSVESALLSSVTAQEPLQETPPLRVIDQITIREGARNIIMQRVAPPLPKAVAEPEPTSPSAPSKPEPSPAKPQHFLFLSCVVYDHQISMVNWTVEGRKYRAYINADLNDISQVTTFETADAAYSLFLGLGNNTAESIGLLNADLQATGQPASELIRLPALTSFPAGHSSYLLADGTQDPAQADEDCAGLEAILEYYDANKTALQQARQQREATRLAREQWLRHHPPVPRDTVIQFWPIKSDRYLTTDGKASR